MNGPNREANTRMACGLSARHSTTSRPAALWRSPRTSIAAPQIVEPWRSGSDTVSGIEQALVDRPGERRDSRPSEVLLEICGFVHGCRFCKCHQKDSRERGVLRNRGNKSFTAAGNCPTWRVTSRWYARAASSNNSVWPVGAVSSTTKPSMPNEMY